MHICANYRPIHALTYLTVEISHPVPRFGHPLDRLAGAYIFSCRDLQQAYHQARPNPEDVPKTADKSSMALYEYRVLPYEYSCRKELAGFWLID